MAIGDLRGRDSGPCSLATLTNQSAHPQRLSTDIPELRTQQIVGESRLPVCGFDDRIAYDVGREVGDLQSRMLVRLLEAQAFLEDGREVEYVLGTCLRSTPDHPPGLSKRATKGCGGSASFQASRMSRRYRALLPSIGTSPSRRSFSPAPSFPGSLASRMNAKRSKSGALILEEEDHRLLQCRMDKVGEKNHLQELGVRDLRCKPDAFDTGVHPSLDVGGLAAL